MRTRNFRNSYYNWLEDNTTAQQQQMMDKWVTFEMKKETVPVERHGHTVVNYKDKLYLFGGTPDGSSGLSDLLVLDAINHCWVRPVVKGTLPSGRYRHTATVVGSKMFVFGGYRSKCLGDLHELDLETLTWSQPICTGSWPSPRSSHSAVAWGSKLVIFGGSGHKYSNELFTFDTSSYVWQKEETFSDSTIPAERWCHTAVLFGKKMFVFGGSNDRRRDAQVYILDLETMHWSRPVLDGVGPQARQLHSACAIGQCMVIFGGWVPHTELSDLFVLNTRTLTWIKHTPESIPPARQLHSACTWQGNMVVFGGYSKNKRMNDLHIYSLENNICSLQDLCIDKLVTHLPHTLPHVHNLSEELLLSLFRKIGQTGQLTLNNLPAFFDNAPFLSELPLVTCSDAVDDAWLDVLTQSRLKEHLLKVDLTNCKRITDCGLKQLGSLPKLRVVVVDGESEVTSEGAMALKQLVPGACIVRVVAVGGESVYLEFAPK